MADATPEQLERIARDSRLVLRQLAIGQHDRDSALRALLRIHKLWLHNLTPEEERVTPELSMKIFGPSGKKTRWFEVLEYISKVTSRLRGHERPPWTQKSGPTRAEWFLAASQELYEEVDR